MEEWASFTRRGGGLKVKHPLCPPSKPSEHNSVGPRYPGKKNPRISQIFVGVQQVLVAKVGVHLSASNLVLAQESS